MASYIVGSSQVFSASSDADSIWIQSGGAVSTVYGLAGADTISIDGVNDATDVGTVARGGDGADLFNVQSGTFSAGGSQFFGGSGSDTIILSGASTIASLNTNEDADLVNGSGAVTISAASFSTGADTLDIGSGAIVGSVSMGNGHDLFSGNSISVTSAAPSDWVMVVTPSRWLRWEQHPTLPPSLFKVTPAPTTALTSSLSV